MPDAKFLQHEQGTHAESRTHWTAWPHGHWKWLDSHWNFFTIFIRRLKSSPCSVTPIFSHQTATGGGISFSCVITFAGKEYRDKYLYLIWLKIGWGEKISAQNWFGAFWHWHMTYSSCYSTDFGEVKNSYRIEPENEPTEHWTVMFSHACK